MCVWDLGSSKWKPLPIEAHLFGQKKIMKEKSYKQQAASLTACPRDDRIQSELV